MRFDWSEYESDSDTEEVSLLLSVKSQSLILAAMQSLQFRSNWLEVDDATYDDIEASVASAYEEIMRSAMPDFMPVGTIVAWAGVISTIPEKWQICDGHLLDVDDYPELRDALDIPFDDNTFLTVPDLRDRFVYGMGTGSILGATGGAATVALAINELPAHAHAVSKGNGIGNSATTVVEGDNVAPSTSTVNTSSVGSGAAHQNLPPYMRLYYIMKVLP